jgi:predicted Rossmann-fold nucleotide-binding protein
VSNYFTPLLAMIEHMANEGFLTRSFAAMLAVDTQPDRLLARFRSYKPPTRKWTTQTPQAAQP